MQPTHDSLHSFPPEGEFSSFGRPCGTDTNAPDAPDVPGRSDLFADPGPAGLDQRLVTALHGRGITRLYSHQAQALDLAMAGRHVVVATPTASGKSLCYHLPVLQGLLADGVRALYLLP